MVSGPLFQIFVNLEDFQAPKNSIISNVSIQILESTPAKETVKKEQLTKAQKRNAWKKGGLDKGERERGWDWIDVIRHLSQTGSKQD